MSGRKKTNIDKKNGYENNRGQKNKNRSYINNKSKRFTKGRRN
jgi:hypothetical protein